MMSMKAFRERFREESWFAKPQNRTWPTVLKALEAYRKSELKKLGGKITKATSKRDFERFKISYQSMFFQVINDFLKRDVGVKNGLFAAMGAGASTLGEGHVYWMKDITGDEPSLQAEFNALNPRQQRCAIHLQELTRDHMLYHIETVVSGAMRTKLVDLRREKEDANLKVEWQDALDLIGENLKNLDTRYLAESVFTVQRDDQSSLLEWILFFVGMIKYCSDATIDLPNKLYYTMFFGQVSSEEIKHVTYAYPKTEQEQTAFKFEDYRDAVKDLPQDKMPVFYQKQVRQFTQTMLVQPSNVRGVTFDKSADKDDDGTEKRERYCKSCKVRHAKGSHTKEGKKRYAAAKKELLAGAKESIGNERSEQGASNATVRRSARLSSRNRGAEPESKAKCYQCGKVHYPFCPRVPGVRGPCHVCQKTHFPYCPRPRKETRSAEAQEDNESLKLRITQGIADRLNELFMISAVVAAATIAAPSNICRAVITVVMPDGKKGKAVVSPDSVSSVTIAKEEYLHGVHDRSSGPIGGCTGTCSLNKAGYLILPMNSRPGASVIRAGVDQGNLPTRVGILLSKTHSSEIGSDINKLCRHDPMKPIPPLRYDERKVDGFKPTHCVKDASGLDHLCEIATGYDLEGPFGAGYKAVRYDNGSVAVVKADMPRPCIKHGVNSTLPLNAPAGSSQQEVSTRVEAPTVKPYTHATVVATSESMLVVCNEVDGNVWLPGGRLETGETPRQGALREMKEETGLTAKAGDLIQLDDFLEGEFRCAVFAWRVKTAPHKTALRSNEDAAKLGDEILSAKWVPILSFIDAVQSKMNGDGYLEGINTRFKIIGKSRKAELKAQVKAHAEAVFFNETTDPEFDMKTGQRNISPVLPILLSIWTDLLAAKRENNPDAKMYDVDLGDKLADFFSVFDGPRGDMNADAEDIGMVTLPPVDTDAKEPFDILDDVTFCAIMVALLTYMPLFVMFAPECTSWSKANDFNSKNERGVKTLQVKQTRQRKIMLRVRAMLRAVWAYGGDVMIENPAKSKFWDQDFCQEIKSETPETKSWRDVIVNLCMVGGSHFKAMRFRTTAPPEATAHMEKKCDHDYKHPPCRGRNSDGSSKTRATAAYTPTLVKLIVAVGAIMAGYIAGMQISPAATTIDMGDAAWAEEAMKHDVFWATQYDMDSDTAFESCAEWAEMEWTEADSHECYLVRDRLYTYYERTKDLPDKVPGNHSTVVIDKTVPAAETKRVHDAIIKHKRVFDEGLGGLPLAVSGGEVHITLKDNCVPQRCPEPKWGHGPKRAILEKWAREKLASGEFEPAPRSQWGSRPTIAQKTKRGSAKADDDFDIRICGDYVRTNSQCVRLIANQPTIPFQLERGRGHRRYWSTDGRQQYKGWQLEESSRDILAIWTPLGLMRPTVLQYGWLNAGIVCQGDVRIMMENDLSQHAKDHSLQAADDFSGFSDDYEIDGQMLPDWSKLADDFIEMLEMADKNNMSLKASKTVFGAKEAMFFGHILDKDGSRSADHNLTPIEKMVAPENISELRRVLGLCIQHKDAVPGYKRIAKPLFKLTGNVPYDWTDECDAAFETLRTLLLENNVLSAPDWQKKFYCAIDASEDGYGYSIYQLKDTSKLDTRDNRAVMKYASQAWPNSLIFRPPYYQEGFAFVEGASDAKYYAVASPWPLQMKTDHKPLKWMKTCSKGPLNMWRVSKISDLDYEIEHRDGVDNGDADCMSRHPMLGARSLIKIGADKAVSELLKSLPGDMAADHKWWVWAGRDTTAMAKIVQQYKSDAKAIYVRAPKESFNNPAWDVSILLPRTENATKVARQAIDDGRQTCVLMPTELVYYTAQEQDGTFADKYVQAIKAAKKITLMATDSTWLCLNTMIPANDVRSGESLTQPPGPMTGWTPAVGTLEEWSKEQTASLKEDPKVDGDKMMTDQCGLQMHEGRDGLLRIYVPKDRRTPLIKLHHESIRHLAANKTYVSLRRHFYWPSARTDVREYYKTCTFCELSKATRNITHKNSRALESRPPRSRYGMDYYGVGDGEVLGIIDLDSTRVELFWHERRSGENVEKALRDGIINRHGRFDELRSDHAREFIGRAVSELKRKVGFFHSTTGGYNAKGNSTMERFWRFLGNCLSSLTDAQYANAKEHIQAIAFAWNITVSESLDVSPFEVSTGVQPRTIADGFLAQSNSTAAINVSDIVTAAAEFTRLARANADFNRKHTADVLNEHGRKLRELKVGDHVKIFAPPGHKEAIRRNRKQKHMYTWKGPMRITEKISGTQFLLAYEYDEAKTYERHLVNIRRWVGPVPEQGPVDMSSVSDIMVGELVLARDNSKSNKLDLAKVISITDETVTIACYGTKTGNPKTAKFHAVYTEGSDVFLGKPSRNKNAKPWTWKIQIEDLDDLIPARGLTLLKTGRLNKPSIKVLKSIKPKSQIRKFI